MGAKRYGKHSKYSKYTVYEIIGVMEGGAGKKWRSGSRMLVGKDV